MDRDMWSAALTAVGVIAGAIATLILGMIKAKREGLDSISIAEIADRGKFRADLMLTVDKAIARAGAAEVRADRAEERADAAEARADQAEVRADRAELRADAAQVSATLLKRRVEELEARMTHQENNGNG
jgi:hypothetical protein